MNQIINNIKNLLPYFLLIGIYFFFINIEARKNQMENKTKIIKKTNKEENIKNADLQRISIPVIPYNE